MEPKPAGPRTLGDPKLPLRACHPRRPRGTCCCCWGVGGWRPLRLALSAALSRPGYRSLIGRDHFLTKQLQRYIEGLRKRRTKRQHVSAH